MTKTAFEYGRDQAGGIVDMMDAMLADVKVWALASPDFHAGYWHESVANAHAARVHRYPSSIDYNKAQRGYQALAALGYEGN